MEKVVLLADPESKAWDFAKKIQNYLKEEKKVDIPLKEVLINSFPNQELDILVPENVRKKEIYFIHDSTKNPQQWWVELLLLKDLLLSASAETVSFVLPDMHYARQDRKDKPHVPISARTLARTISPGLKRIITMDLHAAQIQGFYSENVPLDNLYSFPEVIRHLKKTNILGNLENLVVVSPDAGAVDKTRKFARGIGSKYPIALIYKTRDNERKIDSEKTFFLGDVDGKDAITVDDIFDTCGTSCKSAKLLRKNNAKRISCYGTHGWFSKGTEKLCSVFDTIITTNTWNHHYNGKIESVDVTPIFAEAIYRAQKGLSISELFR